MIDVIRETQLPVLAVLLLLAAVGKTAVRPSGAEGPMSLLPARVRRPAALATAGVEAAFAVLLVAAAGPLGDAARAGTAALFGVAVLALLRLRRRDPEQGCGCFGGLSSTPVGWRTIARAGLLAAAAAAALGLPVSGLAVATGFTATHAAVLAVELAVLGVLSPELVEIPRRVRHRVPCELREVPLSRTLRRLYASDVWHMNAEVVTTAEPVDVWRQECLRFVRFGGRRQDRAVDVVFAVPMDGRPPVVRALIVDVETGVPVASFGAVADPPRPRRAPEGETADSGRRPAPYEVV
ncbi:MauE/DoxX family redox-associated membrane protein [Marinitenerispora sediminis]|uniref:Methylamine utilization protein MauD n=1 Tax=Marinitenerispora sediminis TaxID=1931232 RepID=A0A368T827_9ACTN|nr:MauE/DoxX family redox-associated membrane protein [Marinitenerispora sediminis]RCV51349.1 methylamine utilization protein MauD [Marinitenerispora sediminis]RCV57177.1 methylamine utilization protein MauD [Marinitenerispora sediminis]RCV60316.1 methylamine utilization protein MauD [Marinitenerispora sediminis]